LILVNIFPKNGACGIVEKGVAKMQYLSNRRNMCSIMPKTEGISGTVSVSQVTVPANFRSEVLFQQPPCPWILPAGLRKSGYSAKLIEKPDNHHSFYTNFFMK